MQAFIDALVTYSQHPDRFSICVRAEFDPRVFFLVPINYCPFCGVRIDPQWAESIYKPQPKLLSPMRPTRSVR
jgi:hypothetical protein